MNRFRVLLLSLFCFAAAGCVEGEVRYTINPNGSAKIRFDVVTPVPPTLGGPPPGMGNNPMDESIDSLRRNAIRQTLESPGIAAWKDVTAEFLPNGKLKFGGTALVRQISDFKSKGGLPLISSEYRTEATIDGALVLVRKSDPSDNEIGPGKRKPKTPDEIKKLTDDQLDEEILRDLIEIQSTRGLLTAFLTDMNMKSTFVLPGDVTAVVGFTRDGKSLTTTLNGNMILARLNKALAEDRAAWRARYRAATSVDHLKVFVLGEGSGRGEATVAKPGEAQFDIDKEVKDARAAYPELRKKFGFGDDLRLPTTDSPPPPGR